MSKSNEHYFVKVTTAEESYYAGPFAHAKADFANGDSAIDWIYRQIGILKAANPDSHLVKHAWEFIERDGGFFDARPNIRVEVGSIVMEVLTLASPGYTNVLDPNPETKPAVSI
jgi:hypothetical protein